jgi:hypothetical protein
MQYLAGILVGWIEFLTKAADVVREGYEKVRSLLKVFT